MTLPSQDARAVAEWLAANHLGQVLEPGNEALVADIAQVLEDFRAEQKSVSGITKNQSKLLKFYREFQCEHGHTPSYQQAADGLGWVKSRVFDVLHQLEARGIVIIHARKASGVTIVAGA